MFLHITLVNAACILHSRSCCSSIDRTPSSPATARLFIAFLVAKYVHPPWLSLCNENTNMHALIITKYKFLNPYSEFNLTENMCTSPCDAVLMFPHCTRWMHQEGEAASQHLVQLSGMQRCKPWGRCMARQEHVGTRGGDGRASDHSFFNDTPLLSPRSSCSSSCSVLNKAKPFSQKCTASQNRARKDMQLTTTAIFYIMEYTTNQSHS